MPPALGNITAHLFQFVILLIQAGERFQRLLALIELAKPTDSSGEDVVIRRRALVQEAIACLSGIGRRLQLSLTLFSAASF